MNLSLKKYFLICLLVVLAYGFGIYLLNNASAFKNSWSEFQIKSNRLGSFCEQYSPENPVRQPFSTFSNIGYLLVAIFIAAKNPSRKNKMFPQNDSAFYSNVFAGILLCVFLASSWYHASLTYSACKFDHTLVFFFALFPVFFIARNYLATRAKIILHGNKIEVHVFYLILFLLTGILISWLTPMSVENIIVLVLILLVFITAVYIFSNRNNPGLNYLKQNLFFLLFALCWFVMDKSNVLCFLQPHSIWHLLTAISAFYFFLYMRSTMQS